jgi:hypothetical protein
MPMFRGLSSFVAVEALPASAAVMMFAEKSPLASRITAVIVLAICDVDGL